MFGFGRRNEMKKIQSETQRYAQNIEMTLENMRDVLNETIEIAHKSKDPEYNVINQKNILGKHIYEIQELLLKYKGNLTVAEANIAHELAVEDMEIGVSEVETMVYSLKNMDIPTSESVSEYFSEYEENYKVAIQGASLAAGVGVLATGGVALGTSLTVAGLTTGGIIGTSLVGAGSLLGGIGAIVSGPVGWIIGGIGLLGWLGSAPTQEEIAEAREKLEEIQMQLRRVDETYYETVATRGKAKAVIKLSKNFTDVRTRLTNLFRININSLENEMEKNIIENRRKLRDQLVFELNDDLNKLVSELYRQYRNKKRLRYFFKRKTKIWEAIENGANINEILFLMEKYLKIPKSYKQCFNNIAMLLVNSDLENIEILDCFNRADSYMIKENELLDYREDLVEANVKIDSPVAKKKIKEMLDFVKLIKNIIVTPMINIETHSLTEVEGLEDMVSNSGVKAAEAKMIELKGMDIVHTSQILGSNEGLSEDEKYFIMGKYPQWCDEYTDFNDIEVKKGILGKVIDYCTTGIKDIENLALSDEQLDNLGVTEFKSKIVRD